MPNKSRCCAYVGWLKFTGIVAQLALCGVMVVLLRGRAQEAVSNVGSGKAQYTHVCLLAIEETWMAVCSFAEVLAYSGLLLSFIIATLQAYLNIVSSRGAQHIGPDAGGPSRSMGWAWWTQQLLLVVSLLWWTAGGTLLQVHLTQADAAWVAQPAVRTAVSACCWLSVVLLVVLGALELLLRTEACYSAGTPMLCSLPAPVAALAAVPPPPPAAAAAATPGSAQQVQPTASGRPASLSALLSAVMVGQPQPCPRQLLQGQHQLLPQAQVIGIPVVPPAQPPRRPSPELAAAGPPAIPAAAALAALPAAVSCNIGPAQLQMALLSSGMLQANPALRQQHFNMLAHQSRGAESAQRVRGRGATRGPSAPAGDVVMHVAIVNAGPSRLRSSSRQQMPPLQASRPRRQRDRLGGPQRNQHHQPAEQHSRLQQQAVDISTTRP